MARETIASVSPPLRIATRQTDVALRRARAVQVMLAAREVESELVPIRTSGDRHFEQPLAAGGGRDAFTRELESALSRNKADVAVHALSDMPADQARGLVIAAVPARGDPRDALVLNDFVEARSLAELPRGTSVGTSSVRRRSLLLALYPEIEVVHLKGDLVTRLRKVEQGQVHATIVPAASLHLLDVSQQIAAMLDPATWVPAAAQGAIAIQARADDHATIELVAPLNDPRCAADTTAERALLHSLEGGLQSPIGASVQEEGGARVLRAVIVDLHGRRLLRSTHRMDDHDPALVGIRLANELRGLGASTILDELRAAERLPAPQPE